MVIANAIKFKTFKQIIVDRACRGLVGTIAGGCMLVAAIELTGCGTPMAVKKLSAEQVRVNTSFELTLKAYFDVVEKLAANQLAASTEVIDTTTKAAIALEKKKALNSLKGAADDAGKQKAVDDLTAAITAESDEAASDKAQINTLVGNLKKKHKDMLAAFAAIKAAQEKLDTYIQLKKADEAAFDQLLGIVGVSRETLNRDTTEVADIADNLTKLLSKGSKQ
jgi:hypothetical protein